MSLTEDIKSLAFEAGFHTVGITTAEPFVGAERVLRERLERGLLEGSGFDLDVIHLYTHPRKSLAAAKSIVSVALSYFTDDMESGAAGRGGTGLRGWMARFARGKDYHQVLHERLFLLAGDIQTKLGRRVETRSFADTGPLVDRAAAIRAGLGSRCKNTCVHVGEYGSWVVLGELLADVELEPDEPAPLDICGECDECVKACPTGSICAPYVVDVHICLSQVTQSKGCIPRWLREKMGTRVYGCDTCQSACPLNKGAKPGNVEDFRPSEGLGKDPELLPLLTIGPAEFKELIGPTTAGWIRRTRFRRNVAVALGNLGDPAAVCGLVEALSDPESVIRGHAAWALGRIGTADARHALQQALSKETNTKATDEIRAALDAS